MKVGDKVMIKPQILVRFPNLRARYPGVLEVSDEMFHGSRCVCVRKDETTAEYAIPKDWLEVV